VLLEANTCACKSTRTRGRSSFPVVCSTRFSFRMLTLTVMQGRPPWVCCLIISKGSSSHTSVCSQPASYTTPSSVTLCLTLSVVLDPSCLQSSSKVIHPSLSFLLSHTWLVCMCVVMLTLQHSRKPVCVCAIIEDTSFALSRKNL